MRSRSGAGSAVGAVAVALAVLSGCGGGDGDGGGADESPTPTRTQRTPSPSPTDRTASPSPSPTQTARATVSLRSVDGLGEILTDGEGRTLYLFEADTSEKSTCYDACAEAWPPLTTSGAPEAGGDVESALLGVSDRRDGDSQVTYDGHPLYYYASDVEPGETEGQGLDDFGDLWWVVDSSGKAVRDGEGGDGEDGGSTTGGY